MNFLQCIFLSFEVSGSSSMSSNLFVLNEVKSVNQFKVPQLMPLTKGYPIKELKRQILKRFSFASRFHPGNRVLFRRSFIPLAFFLLFLLFSFPVLPHTDLYGITELYIVRKF